MGSNSEVISDRMKHNPWSPEAEFAGLNDPCSLSDTELKHHPCRSPAVCNCHRRGNSLRTTREGLC